jgi:glyoxylase-like metal-dependent hydrolase (beta-lactamase superfamily II)
MTELLTDVLRWTWFSEKFQYDFNGYLVRHASGNLCIDPVEMSAEVLDEIAHEGVSRIVLTNRNHFRAAERVRVRTGARVAVHPADAAFVREKGVTVDEALAIGQTIGPFEIVAADGKSPGEVALYDAARKRLVVGDACVGNPPGECGLLPAAVMDAPDVLKVSLRRLATLDFDTLLLGDGEPILTGGRAALERLVSTFA